MRYGRGVGSPSPLPAHCPLSSSPPLPHLNGRVHTVGRYCPPHTCPPTPEEQGAHCGLVLLVGGQRQALDERVQHVKALVVMRLAGDELLEDAEEWDQVAARHHLVTRLAQVRLVGGGGEVSESVERDGPSSGTRCPPATNSSPALHKYA